MIHFKIFIAQIPSRAFKKSCIAYYNFKSKFYKATRIGLVEISLDKLYEIIDSNLITDNITKKKKGNYTQLKNNRKI